MIVSISWPVERLLVLCPLRSHSLGAGANVVETAPVNLTRVLYRLGVLNVVVRWGWWPGWQTWVACLLPVN